MAKVIKQKTSDFEKRKKEREKERKYRESL